ncbi:hypothetical protein F5141DRAFT_1075741 [Pisolithus sp. B1]|nr:hypothetical protein F5141DRAFT_1075741 [Pisolithus sp. B1]
MGQKDGGGIQAWTTSIRTAMANDPCRQLFEDQIQVHAFLFLEDYFESIISGPQQAQIIELVKTPSRKKKNIPRKTRTVAADPISVLEFQPNTSDDQSQDSPPPLPSQGHVNELSVIAEDDEPSERSHVRTTSPPTPFNGHRHLETRSPLVSKATLTESRIQPSGIVHTGSGTERQFTSGINSPSATTPIKSSHLVSLGSPHQPYPSNTCTGDDVPSSPRLSHAASINPHDIPSVPSIQRTALPNSEPANTAHKSGAPHYPTLPVPSPLRKSIRVPAEITVSLPSTTPAPASLGKRTSWLVKAREVKAMEGVVVARSDVLNNTLALADSSAPEVPVVSASMKRKSGEMLGNVYQSKNTGERAFKVPKMNESDTVSTRKDDEEKSGGYGSVGADGVGEQGFIGQFKRTVEGLGARSGKSMTKSLGGAAATAALAEARAAAEARVAERNKTTETSGDLVETPGLVVPPRPLSPHQDEEPTLPRSKPDDIERPHFVVDLVSDNAKGQGIQAQGILQSQTTGPHEGSSTTPPHSPRQQHSAVVKHTGPVFTKRTISTILEPAKPLTSVAQPKDFSNLPLGTFTLTTPMSLGVTPQLDSRTTAFAQSLEDERGVLDGPIASETADRTELDRIEGSMMDVCELGDVSESARHIVNQGEPAGVIRSSSQLSMTSATSSSQSETGFFGQATKLVASMLGGGKKDKPEIKSLQRAAATAKRQQDEADKKALRLKEMEARRQAVLSRKAEEEKTRILEDEKRTKEDSERRKREREENVDKRPMKLPTDDSTKKRKLLTETQKKVEAKKPLSKDKKDLVPLKLVKPSVPTPTAKSALPSKSVRCVASALVSSTAYNASQNLPGGSSGSKPTIPEAKPFKLASAHKEKVKAVAQNDGSDKLPSALIQTQMAARAKAQIEASKQQPPEVPSESIELPDINSEYSDSEDEDRVRTFDPPNWAQSPELRQALQMQSTVNPDDIFGDIRPLRMEEIFRTRQSRFRARTSSANWSGADRLTMEEIREYERRMGFRSQAR